MTPLKTTDKKAAEMSRDYNSGNKIRAAAIYGNLYREKRIGEAVKVLEGFYGHTDTYAMIIDLHDRHFGKKAAINPLP